MHTISTPWSTQACTEAFIAEHTDLVRGLAHTYCRDNSYIDDCIQEGFLALMRASELYDSQYELPFRPYAARRIRSAIARWQDNHLEHVRTPIHQLELQRRADRIRLERQSRVGVSLQGDAVTHEVVTAQRVRVYSLDEASAHAEPSVGRARHEIVADVRQPSPEVLCDARAQLRGCIAELREFRKHIHDIRDKSRSKDRSDNRYDVLLWYYFGCVDGGAVSLRHLARRYTITRAAAHQRLANTWRYIRKTCPQYSHRWVTARVERVELLRELITTP